mmetsp:Transcript_9327/g.12918  ORF Transcript_9327/g.12918 Transcript_9327/m.12918 type:complete len:85 (+) Transcript_9327:84-338(+)|eukprot:CAMPEP_0197291212 /NCGR_PEP_ID=MMETSP0890-20130614/11754_1 /TAXON_ID=44058 ORGANISM="Aureoumbra lagunensis, Strain CCMP1510" /NCGR_SAMPLE_ID=MMETSP0890 /ASSEMBLY_ACC=CAM_ASM_000533 /LENGTH=84 /DNA_ID=CAMNT_0042763853 /DNA_START=68 /DNA_END=322 /DNA_ORIENTATION=+
MPARNEPRFDVIDPDPSLVTAIKHWGISDYLTLIGVTGGSYIYGWALGKPLRPQTASTAAIIGSTFGFLYLYSCTVNRLMGYTE